MPLIDREKFQAPQDGEVKGSAVIVLGALAFLVIASRVFRDVNAS